MIMFMAGFLSRVSVCSAAAGGVAVHGRLTLVWLSFGCQLAIMVMFCLRGQAQIIGKDQAGPDSA